MRVVFVKRQEIAAQWRLRHGHILLQTHSALGNDSRGAAARLRLAEVEVSTLERLAELELAGVFVQLVLGLVQRTFGEPFEFAQFHSRAHIQISYREAFIRQGFLVLEARRQSSGQPQLL